MSGLFGIADSVKQFCWRHRAKLGVGMVCVAGGAALYYYYTGNEYSESECDGKRSRDDPRSATRSTETSRMLVAADELYGLALVYFVPNIKLRVKDSIDVSATIRRLKELKNDHSDDTRSIKVNLWDDIKLSAFSSFLTTVYSLSMASVLLRVQMYILVRDATEVGDGDQPEEDIFKALLEGTYGTFFKTGIESLAGLVKAVVEAKIREWSVERKLKVDFEEVCDIVRDMRDSIEGDVRNIIALLFLPDMEYPFSDAGAQSVGSPMKDSDHQQNNFNGFKSESGVVSALFSQTGQVMQSVIFRTAVEESIEITFGVALNFLRECAFSSPECPGSLHTIPLAGLLPKVKTVTGRLIPENIHQDRAAVESIKEVTAGPRVSELCRRVYSSPESLCDLTPSSSYMTENS